MIELRAGRLRMTLDPLLGASVTRFGMEQDDGLIPLLAPSEGQYLTAADSAMFLMAPFANRARDNQLRISDRVIPVEPNTAEPLALHGTAWQREWTVEQQGSDRARLSLDLCGHDPLDLRMTFEAALTKCSASFRLEIENVGDKPFPVGMGFHPYFPRRTDTRVTFAAQVLWPEGEGHLPSWSTAIPTAEDYRHPRELPPSWRNQCYSGWSGTAIISQPSLGYNIRMTARELGSLMFFAAPDMQHFALEPQSHVSGNTATGPNGLAVLEVGDCLASTLQLEVSRCTRP